MATPTLQGQSTGTESIIAGYFPAGDDAHRAINALLDEGFLPEQIGAAFHTGSQGGASTQSGTGNATGNAAGAVLGGDSMRAELGTTVSTSQRTDNTIAGAASDDSAVQPAGIATGSGSPFLSVGRPGPISGSSLEHTGLPSELVHELPDSSPRASSGDSFANTAAPVTPAARTGSAPQHHLQHTDTSWGAKIKHLFQPKQHDSPATTTAATTSESQNFGTGEGSLGIAPPYGHPYAATDFERSVSSAGVAPEHSQHISRRLSGGGAVVTVQSTGRTSEVERIFERHHGHVRFASSTFEDAPAYSGGDARVEVFGHLEHIYPNYNR